MDEALEAAVRESVGPTDAYYVGGCLRNDALGRAVLDVDIAGAAPYDAAREFRRRTGQAMFELSSRHGAWRVLYEGGVTVDFIAVRGTIDEDLRLRDFTVNAVARHVHTGAYLDPTCGLDDLRNGVLRAVSDAVFDDDPLRLLRAVRLEDELPLALDDRTEALVRARASAVTAPAGERVLAELERLTTNGFRRLDELGLLAPLGGSIERLAQLGPQPSSELLLIATLRERLLELPVSRELARMTRALLRAEPPEGHDARATHRFRRATEPWALEALGYLGDHASVPFVRAARNAQPDAPLLRGDELGIGPGPEVGRLLALIEEERAAGTISTRDEARAFVEGNRI